MSHRSDDYWKPINNYFQSDLLVDPNYTTIGNLEAPDGRFALVWDS